MEESRLQNTPIALLLRLVADLMIVNVLIILCSIPVITIGASLSAAYAVMFDREQNEGFVAAFSTFFRAFSRNFGKATLLELLLIVIGIVIAGDYWFAGTAASPVRAIYQLVGTVILMIGLVFFVLSFAQQAIYQNSVAGYLKNSLKLVLCAPWQFLVCAAAWVIPWFLLFGDAEIAEYLGFFPILFGFSFPVWVTAKLYRKVFQKAGSQHTR